MREYLILKTTSTNNNSTFYFYNPTTVAFGKLEFKKIWGNRAATGNWRISTTATTTSIVNDTLSANNEDAETVEQNDAVVEKYTTEFYLKQLPVEKVVIDSINKERNFANYQLGIIYKEKFKENLLAVAKLEKLLNSFPEEKLVLPAMYNLYKLYQITDVNKAVTMKTNIIAQYPDSRYAEILNNTNPNADSLINSPEGTYTKWYRLYQQEQYAAVLAAMDQLILQFSGEEIVSKLELLKAHAIGKLKGVTAYKNALQNVADNYPNTDEGKNAQVIINEQIQYLEKMEFVDQPSNNWKILYKVGLRDDQATKDIQEKIKKFILSENIQNIYFSFDGYTDTEQFITIHGINSKLYADDIAFMLSENVKFKITNTPIVVSAENYKVIQIKKNLETYQRLK